MLYLILLIALVIVGTLIYLMLRLKAVGRDVVAKAYAKAQDLAAAGRTHDAITVIYRTLRANGWDYEGYKAVRKPDQQTTIRQTEPSFTKIARLLRAMPANNFDWVVEPLYYLATLYKSEAMYPELSRLFLDLRRFIDDYGNVLGRVRRADLLARISREQALIELDERNYRSALHMEAAAFLDEIEKLHAAGDVES